MAIVLKTKGLITYYSTDRKEITMTVFSVPYSVDRILRYSPYFHNLVKYGGWTEGQEICLPPILTQGEYMLVFWALAAPHGNVQVLYELLSFFQQRSFRPMIQFILYFLNEEFLPDLLKLEISRRIKKSPCLITEVLNAVGCESMYTWENSSGEAMTLSQWVGRHLAQYITIKDDTLLSAMAIQSSTFGRVMVSYRLLKKYVHNGVTRRQIEERKEMKECCVCAVGQLTLAVGEWRLTGGLHRMPCCATPVHPQCFWSHLSNAYPHCVKCDSPLNPNDGTVDRDLSHLGHVMDRMQRRDLQGVARRVEIPPPMPALLAYGSE